MGYNPILYFVVHIVPSLDIRSSLSWPLCFIDTLQLLWSIVFFSLQYFLCLTTRGSGSSCIFSVSGLGLDIRQGALVPFIREWYRKQELGAMYTQCFCGVVASGPSQLAEKENCVCVCVLNCVCMFMYLYTCISICNHMQVY